VALAFGVSPVGHPQVASLFHGHLVDTELWIAAILLGFRWGAIV
jgi:hypothetical protein